MRLLLLGRSGQLGWELERALSPLGQLTALDFPEIDFTRPADLQQLVHTTRPAVIVNAAAYTDVDRAESEPDLAQAINATAPGVLAQAAQAAGALLVHYSTDYVFDGALGREYLESDTPNPLGVYGQSKLAGEQAVLQAGGACLVLRTSWVYSTRRPSFVTKVLEWSRKQKTLRIVTDQVSSPTWARSLAETTALALAQGVRDMFRFGEERRGVYHLAGAGTASRYEWAQAVLACDPRREEQVAQELLPARTEDFPTPARRPLYSALNCERFEEVFAVRMPPWSDSLVQALAG